MPHVVLYIVSHHNRDGKWIGEFFTDREAAARVFETSKVAEELWEVPVEVDLDSGRVLDHRKGRLR
jgi:hypothetical protein